MKPPTDPPSPRPSDEGSAKQAEDRAQTRRPGGHGSYKLGGEPAIGHRWHEAPAPAPATLTPFDDGVPHRHHEPGEEDPLHNVDVEHEHRDISLRAVIVSAVGITVVVLVSQVLMWGLFGVFERRAAAADPQVSPLAPPGADMPSTTRQSPFFNPSVGGPQLMTNEPMGLEKQRDVEQKRLQGYGWVNQAGGVAHMPIDEAKKLIRERGLPVRTGTAVDPSLGTRQPSRGEASGGRLMVVGSQPADAPAPAPAAPHSSELPHSGAPTAKPQGTGRH